MRRRDVAMRQGKTAVHATTVYPCKMAPGRDHMASFWSLISCRNFLMDFLYVRRIRRRSQYSRRRSRSSSLRGGVKPRHIAWNSFFVVAISKRQKGRWMIQKDNSAMKLKSTDKIAICAIRTGQQPSGSKSDAEREKGRRSSRGSDGAYSGDQIMQGDQKITRRSADG